MSWDLRWRCFISLIVAAGLALSACAVSTKTEPLPSTSETTPGAPEETTSAAEMTGSAEATGPLRLNVGETARYSSGLSVTVKGAGRGPGDMTGAPTFKISVRYDNKGTDAQPFNELDWQVEDSNGARTNDIATLAENLPTLGSGELAPGGTKTGDIYFALKGQVAKVVYSATIFGGEEARATWAVSQPNAEAVYNEAKDLDKRIVQAANHVNAELGEAGTVSNDTLLECESLRDEVQSALSDARAMADPRGRLLVQVLDLDETRAQALVEGAQMAREGGDYLPAFQRGQDAKAALGALQPKLNAAFGQ